MITEPIIWNDNINEEHAGDVLFFRSIHNAERYLEPDNVLTPTFVYDAEGYKLSLYLMGNRVKLKNSGDAANPEHLKEILLEFFSETERGKIDFSSKSLLELVEFGVSNYEIE